MKLKIDVNVTHGVTPQLAKLLARLVGECFPCEPSSLPLGVKIMQVLSATQPDFSGQVVVSSFRDEEGNIVTDPAKISAYLADVNVEYNVDNSAAIAVTPDPADQWKFRTHVGGNNPDGSDAQASLIVNLRKGAEGTLVGTGSESFTVTAGEIASIADVGLQFNLNA